MKHQFQKHPTLFLLAFTAAALLLVIPAIAVFVAADLETINLSRRKPRRPLKR